MLKMDLGANLDNVPYLHYMTEQGQRERQDREKNANRLEPPHLSSFDERMGEDSRIHFEGV